MAYGLRLGRTTEPALRPGRTAETQCYVLGALMRPNITSWEHCPDPALSCMLRCRNAQLQQTTSRVESPQTPADAVPLCNGERVESEYWAGVR